MPRLNAATRLGAVHELETAFARVDSLQLQVARATKLLDHLEKSILAMAFRGELVPQDPADEPAAALFDRIRAERAVSPKSKRGRRAASTISG